MSDEQTTAAERAVREAAGRLHVVQAADVVPLLDRRDAEIARLRSVLGRVSEGATGHLDRDSEMAEWAREALTHGR